MSEGALKGDASIELLVSEARRLTGKKPSARDGELVGYLTSQEVETAGDFFALSDEAFRQVTQAPGASLVLVDALRALRRDRDASRAPTSPRASRAASLPVPKRDAALAGPLCSTAINDTVGVITMTHSRKRNALCERLCSEISAGLDRCGAAGVRVIMLRAEPGAKVWSAGHDMREFERINGTSAQTGSGSFSDPLSVHDPFVRLLSKIRSCPVPVVASVEGGVWGGACDVVACCDIVIATKNSTFAITPAKVGLPYHASGMTHFLGVLPLHVVKYMFLTSQPLNSEEAARYGFVNELVDAEELAQRSLQLCLVQRGQRVMGSRLSLERLSRDLSRVCEVPTLSARCHSYEWDRELISRRVLEGWLLSL